MSFRGAGSGGPPSLRVSTPQTPFPTSPFIQNLFPSAKPFSLLVPEVFEVQESPRFLSAFEQIPCSHFSNSEISDSTSKSTKKRIRSRLRYGKSRGKRSSLKNVGN